MNSIPELNPVEYILKKETMKFRELLKTMEDILF